MNSLAVGSFYWREKEEKSIVLAFVGEPQILSIIYWGPLGVIGHEWEAPHKASQ